MIFFLEQELLNLLEKEPLNIVDILDYNFEMFTPGEKLFCIRDLIDREILILENNIIRKRINIAI